MEIDKELYKQIKEYCELNGLKVKDYINNLLSEAFMKEKYGERPGFIVIKQDKSKVEKAEEKFSKVIEDVGGPDKYNDMVSDLIFNDNVAKNEESDKQVPVPDTMSREVSRKDDIKEERKPRKRKIESR